MLTFACGACGISVLDSLLPFFRYWVLLLPVAFVAYQVLLHRKGRLTLTLCPGNCLVAAVLTFLSLALLFFPVFPIVVVVTFVIFGKELWSKDKVSRYLAISVLALFVVSVPIGLLQSRLQGKYWQLSRLQTGGQKHAFAREMIDKKVFTDDELLEVVRSGESPDAANAGVLLVRKASGEADPDRAAELNERLERIDPKLAREYWQAVPEEVREQAGHL